MKIRPFALLLISALIALPAWASNKPAPAVNANDKASFETVAAWVHKQMESGGRYSDVTKDDRAKVDARLDSMDKLFQEKPDVAQMTPEQKTRMFNSQEEVNAILAKRDDQRLICTSEIPVGSHLPIKTCHTARELAQQRRDTRQQIGTLQSRQSQSEAALGSSAHLGVNNGHH